MSLGSTLATDERRAPRMVAPRCHSYGQRTRMTARMREIEELIAAGLSTKDIAAWAGLTPKSAKFYCAEVYRLTGKTRNQIMLDTAGKAAGRFLPQYAEGDTVRMGAFE